MSGQSHTNHALQFIKAYWFLIIFSLSGIGVLITMWFELQFVIKAVNPESLADYKVEQSVLSTKREIRWCLGKLVATGEMEPNAVLECAD